MSAKKVRTTKTEEVNQEGVTEIKKVTAEELKKLSTLEVQRNTQALQLGVVTYNYQKAMEEYKSQIEKLVTEQNSLGELILSLHGCDSKKESFRIDLQTGVIHKIG